jgi:AcrR family transcriptional regulator
MGRESYKEREKRRREDDILITAERLLAERGYANLTMDELAEVVGISKPTLYQHFKSKEELTAQVFIRGFVETEQFLAEPLTEPAIDRILAMIRWSITRRQSVGNVFTTLRPDLFWNVLRANPQVEECKAQVHTHLIKLIEIAKSEGDIAQEVPTPMVLHSVLSLQWALHSPMLQAQIAQNPDNLSGVIDHLLYMFRYGVTPRANN